MNTFHIVVDSTLYGTGSTPEEALSTAQKYGIDTNLTLNDLIDNTNGKRHQVTNRDVVLRENLDDVYIP